MTLSPPLHWIAIPLRSWRSRIFSKIIPNRRRSIDIHTIWGLDGSSTFPLRFYYASIKLLPCFCYNPATTMKIPLSLAYADGDAAANLLQPRRWSYAFVALLNPFYIKSENQLVYVQLNVSIQRKWIAMLKLAIMSHIHIMLDGEAQSKRRWRDCKRFWVRPWLSADRQLQFGHYNQEKKSTKDGR